MTGAGLSNPQSAGKSSSLQLLAPEACSRLGAAGRGEDVSLGCFECNSDGKSGAAVDIAAAAGAALAWFLEDACHCGPGEAVRELASCGAELL